jgi:alpha-galactosidase
MRASSKSENEKNSAFRMNMRGKRYGSYALKTVQLFAGRFIIVLVITAVVAVSVKSDQEKFPITIHNGSVEIRIDGDLSFQIVSSYEVKSRQGVNASWPGTLSSVRFADTKTPGKFLIVPGSLTMKEDETVYGTSTVVSFEAQSQNPALVQSFRFVIPTESENVLICRASLTNESDVGVEISSYSLLNCMLDAREFGADSSYKFWSFQGGSYEERYDWIFPLTPNYRRANYQGMNAPDYGGGIPVVDFWTKNAGIAFAVISDGPRLVSLPVKVTSEGTVSFSIEDSNKIVIKPHESVELVRCALISHQGDFFNGLRTYSRIMQAQGLVFPKAPSSAYQPEWCAWGYERDFTKEQILKSLPTVKKLGFGWVTIDDGWQNNVGDWQPSRSKFPGGEVDFKAFIDSIHSYGLKVRLWWCPLAAQDSAYSITHYPSRMNEYGMNAQTAVSSMHPGWFILDSSGNRIQVSWWNAYSLCPALEGVRNYFTEFTRKATVDWKIDGFKMDGQNLNMVPECYDKSHQHSFISASCNGVPEFFKDIYATATSLNNSFLVQLCPCGTNFSIYNLPFVNQTVASDPLDAWQVRLKGKTFKALYGSRTISYSGDHAELTNHTWDEATHKFVVDGEVDFASTLAVGGVPASKFTVNGIPQKDTTLALDRAGMEYYERWLGIYNAEKLAEGEYLNLYDIAFDRPETHLIKRGETFYYSFFSDSHFDGRVELRGLAKGEYTASDIYSGKILSTVTSDAPVVTLHFDRTMIVKVMRNEK